MTTGLDRRRSLAPTAGEIVSVVGLAALCWGVLADQLSPVSTASEITSGVLLAGAGGAWLAWSYLRRRSDRSAVLAPAAALVVCAACGGALVVLSPTAAFFVGVAELRATLLEARWPWPTVGASALASTGVAMAVSGAPAALELLAATAAVSGALLGVTRRESSFRQAQAQRLEVAEARREAEAARAEVLAAHNHLARELHDVLSHTLSALSIQLEVLDGLLDRGVADQAADRAAVAGQLRSVKRLVRDGLEEARNAVAALRDDQPPLEERLAALAAGRGTTLDVSGEARVLAPEVAHGLYRAAQEALTNVAKHAPGVQATVRLDYGPDRVRVAVANPLPGIRSSSPLAGTGGGWGIEGVAERVRLLGGRLEVGPTAEEWRLSAEVPG